MFHYDLHCHTCFSKDSPAKIERTVAVAKKRGIDGIGVTDHNKVYNGPLNIDGVDIIPGSEITLKEGGHLLAYFITDEIIPNRGLKATVADIKRQGGYAILAHPLRDDHGWIKKSGGRDMDIDDALKILDGLEAGNASVPDKEREEVSRIAKRAGLVTTAGSDLHMPGQVGFSVVETQNKITRENFMQEMKDSKIIIRPEAEIFRNDVRRGKKVATKIAKTLGLYNIEFAKYLFFVLIIKNFFRFKNRKFEAFRFNFKD